MLRDGRQCQEGMALPEGLLLADSSAFSCRPRAAEGVENRFGKCHSCQAGFLDPASPVSLRFCSMARPCRAAVVGLACHVLNRRAFCLSPFDASADDAALWSTPRRTRRAWPKYAKA